MNEPRKPRVLVIDDEVDVLLMTREFFELRGYEVFTALDGETGLVIGRHEVPDLVLLDFKLKGFDGPELLRCLGKLSQKPRIFVISAHQEEDMESKIKRLGADLYFEKPVSILEIERAAREFLKKHYPAD